MKIKLKTDPNRRTSIPKQKIKEVVQQVLHNSYFTKYIQVGGEIKIGVLTNKGLVKSKLRGGDENLFITDTLIDGKCIDSEDDCFSLNELYPIKLFLCKKDNHFNIIGEISKEAGWVKENDIFHSLNNEVRKQISIESYYADAEEQFQYYDEYIDVNEKYVPIDKYGHKESILKEVIQVKGCCNHFH